MTIYSQDSNLVDTSLTLILGFHRIRKVKIENPKHVRRTFQPNILTMKTGFDNLRQFVFHGSYDRFQKIKFDPVPDLLELYENTDRSYFAQYRNLWIFGNVCLKEISKVVPDVLKYLPDIKLVIAGDGFSQPEIDRNTLRLPDALQILVCTYLDCFENAQIAFLFDQPEIGLINRPDPTGSPYRDIMDGCEKTTIETNLGM